MLFRRYVLLLANRLITVDTLWGIFIRSIIINKFLYVCGNLVHNLRLTRSISSFDSLSWKKSMSCSWSGCSSTLWLLIVLREVLKTDTSSLDQHSSSVVFPLNVRDGFLLLSYDVMILNYVIALIAVYK